MHLACNGNDYYFCRVAAVYKPSGVEPTNGVITVFFTFNAVEPVSRTCIHTQVGGVWLVFLVMVPSGLSTALSLSERRDLETMPSTQSVLDLMKMLLSIH